MRFLHTSDWHLGMTFRGGVSYRRDQKYMIQINAHIRYSGTPMTYSFGKEG